MGVGGSHRDRGPPHTLVILFGMVILAQILSYLIPAGSFERVENAAGRLQVVPGSFQLTPDAEPALSPLGQPDGHSQGASAEPTRSSSSSSSSAGHSPFCGPPGPWMPRMGALLRRWGDRPFWLVAGGTFPVRCWGPAPSGSAKSIFPSYPSSSPWLSPLDTTGSRPWGSSWWGTASATALPSSTPSPFFSPRTSRDSNPRRGSGTASCSWSSSCRLASTTSGHMPRRWGGIRRRAWWPT